MKLRRLHIACACYLKFEPGASESLIYKPWIFDDFHDHPRESEDGLLVRERIGRINPDLRRSDRGPEALALPAQV
jgi:hypothetical protein